MADSTRTWVVGWRGGLLVAVILLVGLAGLHPEIMLQGKVYSSSDAQAAAAFQRVAQRAQAAGEFPHWNPYVFVGMPSFASLGYASDIYPLNRPIRELREGLGLVPMTWLLVHLLVAAAGMTGWMRWRGHSWTVAAFAGLLVIAMPKVAAWSAYGHGTKVGTFAWLPFVLWFTEGLLRRGSLGWAAGLAACLAMQLLRGHVQIAYYSVIAVGFLVLFLGLPMLRDPEQRRTGGRRIALVALAGIVALGAALVLYLPVLEYQQHSIRGSAAQGGGAAWDYATNWSLAPSELPTLWWPTASGYGRASYVGGMPFTDYPNYIGLPLLVLALVGVALRRDRWTWCFLALAIVSTLVAFGRHGFLYRLFYELLPGFKKFRVPVMILILQEVAVVVLAMRGLELLVDALRPSGRERPRWLGRPLLVAALSLGLVMVALGTIGADSLRESMLQRWQDLARSFGRGVPPLSALVPAADLAAADALRLGAIVLASTLALVAVTRGRVPREAAMGFVALLLLVDLWRVDQPLLHPERYLPRLAREGERIVAEPSESLIRDSSMLASYVEELEVTRWLHAQEPRPRVWPLGSWAQDNQLAAREVVSLGGYHAAKLKVYEDVRARLFDPSRPRAEAANLLGARWVLAPNAFGERTISALSSMGLDLDPQPRWSGAQGVVYENRSALPEAWMVGEYEEERRGEDTTAREPDSTVLDRVLARDFDPRRRVLLSSAPDVGPSPGAEAAAVEILERGYNGSRIRVSTPAPGILVLNEVWYPEWSVRVDGEAARMLRANHVQRAVALPAGEHVVETWFAADSYRRGLWLSRLSVLLILAGLVAEPVRRRLRRAPGEQGVEA